MKFYLRMLIGWGLPLGLLLVLPLFDVSGGTALLIAILAFIAGRMIIMGGHGAGLGCCGGHGNHEHKTQTSGEVESEHDVQQTRAFHDHTEH